MAGSESWEFAVTVPPATLATAPFTMVTALPPRIVREIHWHIPEGSSGYLGFMIMSSGAQVLPKPIGTFFIRHHGTGKWDVNDLPETGDFSVNAYNLGAYQHTVYITYHVDILRRRREPGRILAYTDLMPVPDLSRAGRPLGGR